MEFILFLLLFIPVAIAMKFLVKPGITGWAQINQVYVNSHQGSRDKLGYELYYILSFLTWDTVSEYQDIVFEGRKASWQDFSRQGLRKLLR